MICHPFRYRNTYKHNLCLDMLQNGFHKSFGEIFQLIKRQAEDRMRAGPESTLWNQTPLADEHEKLDTMKKYLVEAEQALLNGIYNHGVYFGGKMILSHLSKANVVFLNNSEFITFCSKNSLVSLAGNLQDGQHVISEDYAHVYRCHHHLAEYFQGTGDKWLADHFYENCLAWSRNMTDDDGKAAAEGHCNVGLGLESGGKYLC